MKWLKASLALVIVAGFFFFCVSNAQMVQVQFLGYRTPPLPFFLILAGVFFLGFLLAALLGALKTSRLSRRIGQLRREVDALHKGRHDHTVVP